MSESTINPTSIDTFLGLNLSEAGSTQLKLGEASKMENFRITKDYKLKKINGYKREYETNNSIKAMWVGKLGSKEVCVYVSNGKVYDKTTEIGELTDDTTFIFEYNTKLYFLNGHEYKVYDGETFTDVEAYIPLIKIATEPSGVGTDYEGINLLTGKKHQTFSADGTTKIFTLAEKEINSIDKILVNGVVKTATKDLTNGTITFSTAPAQGTDNVDVYWTKNLDNTQILGNHYATKYGLSSDTRIFIYGNSENKNRIYFSDLASGVPNVGYFPATNFIDVGSSNTAVTDISRQYDRLIISKENETYYATYESISDSTGTTIITFPTYPLNSSHGMVAPAQSQLLDNYVTTIDSSIVMWTNTQVKDERNAEIISSRIQEWLNDKNLSEAITMDYQDLKEYWLAIDKEIMIYNYGNSTFYKLVLPIKITAMTNYKGTIYFGSTNGIYAFGNYKTFGDEIIKSKWESGMYDFELEYRRKTMRTMWLALKTDSRTSVNVSYISDRDLSEEPKEIKLVLTDFSEIRFDDFSFITSRNIKPSKIKLKAKKFTYIQINLSNEKKEDLTVNSIIIKKSYGGESK